MSSPRHKRSVKAPMRFKDFVNFDKIRCEQLQQKSAGLVPGDREQLSPDVEPGEVAPSGQLAAAGVPGPSRLLVNQQSADSDSDMSTREVEVNEDEDVELEESVGRDVYLIDQGNIVVDAADVVEQEIQLVVPTAHSAVGGGAG